MYDALIHMENMEALYGSEWRRRGDGGWTTREALKLYRQARWQARLHHLWCWLTRRAHRLFDLGQITPQQAIPGYTSDGTLRVRIDQIRGSADPCRDFDGTFRPCSQRIRARWVNIAAARLAGQALPAVQLIQIGDVYFVRNGHHRISVARALGQERVEAQVSVWHVRGRLPWDSQPEAARMVRQPS